MKTLYEYLALYTSLALLGIICLTWTLFAMPLYFLLPERLGTRVGRAGISYGFRLYAWSLSVTRAYFLDLSAVDALRDGPPVILAPNHPVLIDALLILTRHPNLVCVMKSGAMKNVFLGSGSRLARYVCNEPPRHMVRSPSRTCAAAACCCCFPKARAAPGRPSIRCRQASASSPSSGGAGADAYHRNRFAVSGQGLAAVAAPEPANHVPGAPGRALRTAGDVPAFTQNCQYYVRNCSRLTAEPWLGRSRP